MRKGEIANYKQFLLFSQCFLQIYIFQVHQNAALCGNGLTTEKLRNRQKFILQDSVILFAKPVSLVDIRT